MNLFLKIAALTAASATVATALPAVAAPAFAYEQSSYGAPGDESYNQYRDYRRDRGYDRDDRGYDRGYERRGYRDGGRRFRGNDRRYSCNRGSGTTGLVVGGAAGALLGRGLDGGRDRTLGTVLGAAGGALLGRSVDRNSSGRC